jgi:hypothetical protein
MVKHRKYKRSRQPGKSAERKTAVFLSELRRREAAYMRSGESLHYRQVDCGGGKPSANNFLFDDDVPF